MLLLSFLPPESESTLGLRLASLAGQGSGFDFARLVTDAHGLLGFRADAGSLHELARLALTTLRVRMGEHGIRCRRRIGRHIECKRRPSPHDKRYQLYIGGFGGAEHDAACAVAAFVRMLEYADPELTVMKHGQRDRSGDLHGCSSLYVVAARRTDNQGGRLLTKPLTRRARHRVRVRTTDRTVFSPSHGHHTKRARAGATGARRNATRSLSPCAHRTHSAY